MTIDNSNKIIHGLWIGKNLSPIELLTIHSFIRNGHEFHLWVYDVIENKLPSEVIVEDANKIIPSNKVFRYKFRNQFGHGKGSYAGFSDIFRYKLLFDHGGWWVDMDVTCLRPLDFEDEYVFRKHHVLNVVGNIIKCPKGSSLMKDCYNEASVSIDENNIDWHKPIDILNNNIAKYNLTSFIKQFSNEDSWNIIRKLLLYDYPIPYSWLVLHWVNEEWRRNRINKNIFLTSSTFGKIMQEYGFVSQNINFLFLFKYKLKLTRLVSGLIQLPWFVLRGLKR